MTNGQILKKLSEIGGIYGFMYVNTGGPYKKSEIIFMGASQLSISWDRFTYTWGWPGPDYNIYYFSDYNKTWSFSKKELETICND